MNAYKHENLEIVVAESDTEILVSWKGESDSRNPHTTLAPYLADLQSKLDSRQVRVTFTQLSYMNSATVLPIMDFLKALSETASRVVVQYRQDLQWQATSFRALRIVARHWSNVSVVGV